MALIDKIIPYFQPSLCNSQKESSSHAARKYRYWISKLRDSNFKAFKPITNPYNWPQDPRDSFTAAGSDGEDGGHTAGRAGTVVPLTSQPSSYRWQHFEEQY